MNQISNHTHYWITKLDLLLSSTMLILCSLSLARLLLECGCISPPSLIKNSRTALNFPLKLRPCQLNFLRNILTNSILKSEVSVVLQNFSFWMVLLHGGPRQLKLLKFFLFFAFIYFFIQIFVPFFYRLVILVWFFCISFFCFL